MRSDTESHGLGKALGDYRYTLRVFENGSLVRGGGENAGVFVTTDGVEPRSARWHTRSA